MKNVELHTNTFLKSLENVEIGLSKNIQYLTQVSTGMILFDLGKELETICIAEIVTVLIVLFIVMLCESGFPLGLENLGKCEGILQSGKITQNTGKLRLMLFVVLVIFE